MTPAFGYLSAISTHPKTDYTSTNRNEEWDFLCEPIAQIPVPVPISRMDAGLLSGARCSFLSSKANIASWWMFNLRHLHPLVIRFCEYGMRVFGIYCTSLALSHRLASGFSRAQSTNDSDGLHR